MGVVVPSPDDDQILEAPGQEQFSTVKEPKIAGP
jgi:hypothetical protein